MAAPTLIYCASGNRRFDDAAMSAGFLLGARLPGRTVYHDLYFADQDWKAPERASYIAALREHQPHMATVLDLERHNQLDEVLAWAEDAAAIVRVVVIIPKAPGVIERLPRAINGREIRLGYSVPTRYAGTAVPVWEFAGWPVHLLGGSPHAQMRLARYLDVHSADGNMALRQATTYCQFWSSRRGVNGYWHALADGGHDAPWRAFAHSCRHIVAAWNVTQSAVSERGDDAQSI